MGQMEWYFSYSVVYSVCVALILDNLLCDFSFFWDVVRVELVMLWVCANIGAITQQNSEWNIGYSVVLVDHMEWCGNALLDLV